MAEIQAISRAEAEQPEPKRRMRATRTPGVEVEADKFVVLVSRLGRQLIELPKIDPNNKDEKQQYGVPEAFERGMVITVDDIPEIPGMDNVQRLIDNHSIGTLDHPDAAGAIEALRLRQEQEAKASRGI
jgi:hypothetical protein